MNSTNIVVVGNLTRDLELKYADSGNAYARGSVAVNKRKRQGDDWVDETSFFDFTVFGVVAENANDSLSKGDRVIIDGQLQQRTVEDDEGNKRSFVGILVDNIGADLRFATVSIIKNEKKETSGAPAAGGDFFDDSNF